MTIVQDMLPSVSDLTRSVDWLYILKIALLAAAAICILGGVLRVIFGKGSGLVRAVSACINLVMVYLAAVFAYVLVPALRGALTPLPFLSVTEDNFYLWDIRALDNSLLFPAMLQLFILAFLVNLTENLLPQGKKLLTWYAFRLLTVFICLGLYTGLNALIQAYAPQIYGAWAGAILLALWAFILLTGLLKVLLTVVLAAIHPILSGLYIFFFSNLFGKQFSKAILTTVLYVGLLTLLQRLGLTAFAFDSFSLAAYAPTCLIALVALYLFGKLL